MGDIAFFMRTGEDWSDWANAQAELSSLGGKGRNAGFFRLSNLIFFWFASQNNLVLKNVRMRSLFCKGTFVCQENETKCLFPLKKKTIKSHLPCP